MCVLWIDANIAKVVASDERAFVAKGQLGAACAESLTGKVNCDGRITVSDKVAGADRAEACTKRASS
jgi:hypothetical protein